MRDSRIENITVPYGVRHTQGFRCSSVGSSRRAVVCRVCKARARWQGSSLVFSPLLMDGPPRLITVPLHPRHSPAPHLLANLLSGPEPQGRTALGLPIGRDVTLHRPLVPYMCRVYLNIHVKYSRYVEYTSDEHQPIHDSSHGSGMMIVTVAMSMCVYCTLRTVHVL